MVYCATLDIFSFFFLQLSFLLPHPFPFLRHPAVEGVAPHLQLSCCGAHTHTFFKEVARQLLLARHLVAAVLAASDASQPGEFGVNDEIAAFHSSEQRAEPPVAIVAGAADALFYPSVDAHHLLCAKTLDLKALVLYRLLVCAHSDVSVYHGLFLTKFTKKIPYLQIKNPRNADTAALGHRHSFGFLLDERT